MISAFGVDHGFSKAGPGSAAHQLKSATDLGARMIASRKKPADVYRAQKVAESIRGRMKGTSRRLP